MKCRRHFFTRMIEKYGDEVLAEIEEEEGADGLEQERPLTVDDAVAAGAS